MIYIYSQVFPTALGPFDVGNFFKLAGNIIKVFMDTSSRYRIFLWKVTEPEYNAIWEERGKGKDCYDITGVSVTWDPKRLGRYSWKRDAMNESYDALTNWVLDPAGRVLPFRWIFPTGQWNAASLMGYHIRPLAFRKGTTDGHFSQHRSVSHSVKWNMMKRND